MKLSLLYYTTLFTSTVVYCPSTQGSLQLLHYIGDTRQQAGAEFEVASNEVPL